jgi:hypothetical protein
METGAIQQEGLPQGPSPAASPGQAELSRPQTPPRFRGGKPRVRPAKPISRAPLTKAASNGHVHRVEVSSGPELQKAVYFVLFLYASIVLVDLGAKIPPLDQWWPVLLKFLQVCS